MDVILSREDRYSKLRQYLKTFAENTWGHQQSELTWDNHHLKDFEPWKAWESSINFSDTIHYSFRDDELFRDIMRLLCSQVEDVIPPPFRYRVVINIHLPSPSDYDPLGRIGTLVWKYIPDREWV